MIVERKKGVKKNKIRHLKIKNYKFERVENFKYFGGIPNEDNNNKFVRVENLKYIRVILNEDNNNQIDLQEIIRNANKTYFML